MCVYIYIYMCVCVYIYIYIYIYIYMQQLVRVVLKHNTYQLLYMYSIPPDDWLRICLKHAEVRLRNKLRINNASSWFLLHRCIELHSQQNMKDEPMVQKCRV